MHGIAPQGGTEVSYGCVLCFSKVRDTLTVNENADLLMRDLYIPNTLQKRVLKLAHEGHQGMSKTKALIRTKVLFPAINAVVEEAVKRCIPCQANSTRRETQPIAMSTLSRGPWLELSIDFCGPLPTVEYMLVIMDELSRFPVVEVVRITSAETVFSVVDKIDPFP